MLRAVSIFAGACFLLSQADLSAQTNFLDTSFQIGTGAENGFVESMVFQPDDKILICGNFTSFNGQPRKYVARLHSNGSVDTNFVSDVSYWARAIALQDDGKIIIGGFFNFVFGQSRNLIARLNPDGSLDTTFNPGTGGTGILGAGIDGNANPFIFAIATQPDGKILIGGNFANYNGVSQRGIARLQTNGVLDTTFTIGSGVNSWIRSLQVQPNEQILVTGWFTTYAGQSFNRMVRLHPSGLADTNFNATFGDQTAVYTAALLPDGKMVVGGHTVTTNSVFQQEVVRLHPTGLYDTNFNTGGAGANEKVQSVAVQADGKIVMGGYFSSYNGSPVHHVARLNSDGTLDNTFSASVDSWIWTVRIQKDEKILICGGFNSVNGVARKGIARFLRTPAPWLFQPKKFPDRFEVSVSTMAGTNYTLQYTDSLSTNWISLSPIVGDGAVKTLTNSAPPTQPRFYRVLQN